MLHRVFISHVRPQYKNYIAGHLPRLFLTREKFFKVIHLSARSFRNFVTRLIQENQYNVVHPAAPLRCDAIRIKMTSKQTIYLVIFAAFSQIRQKSQKTL